MAATIIARGISTILRAISAILPNHTKRLVLWSSLYCRMCGAQNFTKDEAKEMGERINDALVITKDSAAFIFPVAVSKFICMDLDECIAAAYKAILNGKPSESASMEFVQSIPTWLRYASDAFMLKDFQSLLTVHQRP